MDNYDFQNEIAIRLKLDLDRDIFDIKEDVFNILQNSEILESDEEKQIKLYRIRIEDENNIEIFYTVNTEIFSNGIESNEDYTYIIFDNYEEAKEYFDNFKTLKTMKNWKESKYSSFNDFCKVGDKVSADIVYYFRDVIPPIINGNNILQVGEPYSHKLDEQNNKVKPTYLTFIKENNFWVYKGDCFKVNTQDKILKKEIYEDNEENESEFEI